MRLPLLSALLLLAGCATTGKAPEAQLGAVRASADAAEKVGARNDALAAQHLQLARAGITRANDLISRGDNIRASYVLERAQADAELSLSLAEEAPLRTEARKILGDLQELEVQP